MKIEEIESLYIIDRIEVYANGLIVKRKPRFPMPRPKGNGKRRGIYEMSRKSKLHLAHLVSNCDVGFESIITLTYGDFAPPVNGKELKRQLNNFLNALRRRYICEYVWFVEFTRRGRAHIHILTTIQPNSNDRRWLGVTWSRISVLGALQRLTSGKCGEDYKIVKEIDPNDALAEHAKSYKVHIHPKAWERIRVRDGAMRYAVKYATKSEQKLVPVQFQNVGRFWGVSTGVEARPLAEVLIGETMREEDVKRVMAETRIGQLPLIPKYILQRDAMEYFCSKGLKLTEIFGELPQNGKTIA